MNYLHELDQTYKHIDAKSKRPVAQPDFSGYCKALWCDSGDFLLNNQANRLLQTLHTHFSENAYIFDQRAEAEAALHWTLFQFQTFPVDVVATTMKDCSDAFEIAKIIGQFPPIHVTFRGVVRTRYGLFLAGYPSWDINKLRAAFRDWGGAAIREPHPQDICHATLLRFHSEPSEADIEALDAIVKEWNGLLVGELRPSRWYYGYGTWLQGSGQPCLIASWPASPQHWILHRGLSAGPDAARENSQERLLAALADGWDVELDIWVRDGALYLGHDWEVAEAGGPVQPFFLTFRNAWVHCKNMEALEYMLDARRECHYFVHDSDEATLTSTGEAWCYPGKFAGRRSICVLPERLPADAGATMIWPAAAGAGGRCQPAGVCSDYLPAHFLNVNIIQFL